MEPIKTPEQYYYSKHVKGMHDYDNPDLISRFRDMEEYAEYYHEAKKREEITIDFIKQNFILFEHDCADMTDEEIKEGIKRVAKNIGSFGATTEEAAKALRVLGDCA